MNFLGNLGRCQSDTSIFMKVEVSPKDKGTTKHVLYRLDYWTQWCWCATPQDGITCGGNTTGYNLAATAYSNI